MSPALRLLQQIGRLCAAGALLAAGAPVHAADELDVKAAVVANLLAFVEWPAHTVPAAHEPPGRSDGELRSAQARRMPNEPLVLCVGAQQPLRAPLTTLNGRAVRQWVLQVRELAPADAIASCHALLVDDRLLAARPALRRELRGAPLLSFADGEQAADAAVCIRLDVIDGRVSFSVDLGTARANGLSLSSRLLRLAREVRE
jgi:hypothetical protein